MKNKNLRGHLISVDDEAFMGSVLKFYLEQEKFSLDFFTDPLFVFDHLIKNKNNYDLLITDWMMPALSGQRLIEKLRALENFEKFPIIVLTAKELNIEEREFLLTYSCLLLNKPVDQRKLMEKINEVIS